MKTVMIALVLIVCVAATADNFPKPTVVKKNIGDINGDGKKEVAVEEWSSGSSGNAAIIKIFSGKRLVFGPIGLSGGTADGYKVVGKQIVVWQGDWDTVESKWELHFYDFTWYRWDSKKKCFSAVKEGFTKKKYTYDAAKKSMSQLAVNPSKLLVLSGAKSFKDQAISLVSKKFGKLILQAEFSVANTYSNPNEARYCEIVIADKKKKPTSVVTVVFYRDGQIETVSTPW